MTESQPPFGSFSTLRDILEISDGFAIRVVGFVFDNHKLFGSMSVHCSPDGTRDLLSGLGASGLKLSGRRALVTALLSGGPNQIWAALAGCLELKNEDDRSAFADENEFPSVVLRRGDERSSMHVAALFWQQPDQSSTDWIDRYHAIVERHTFTYLDRHNRILREADEAAKSATPEPVVGAANTGQLLETLHERALDLVQCDWAATFTQTSGAAILPTAGASIRPEGSRIDGPASFRLVSDTSDGLPAELPNSPETIAHAAMRYSRPFSWSVSDMFEPGVLPWDPIRQDSACELAIPIPASERAASPPMLGMLVVGFRDRNSASQFNRRDIVALTHLCRQVSSDSSRALMRALPLVEKGSRTAAERLPENGTIPADIMDLRGELAEIVMRLQRETVASRVSLRFISSDGTKAVLIAGSPSPTDEHTVDEIDLYPYNKSLTAWCLRHGETRYIPDVSNKRHIAEQCPGLDSLTYAVGGESGEPTRSSVLVPIWSDEVLVGSLNLRSPYVGAFEGFEPLLGVIGSSIAARISANRHADVMAAIGLSAGIQGYAHSLDYARRELNRAAGLSDPTEVRTILQTSASTIEKALNFTQSTSRWASDDVGRRTRLGLVIEDSIFAARELHKGKISVERAGYDTNELVSGSSESALRFVLAELLLNAVRHGAVGDRVEDIATDVLIYAGRRAVRGGRNYVDVTVKTQAFEPEAAQLQRLRNRLYRTPIGGDGAERHLGAYYCGLVIRAVGGQIRLESVRPNLESAGQVTEDLFAADSVDIGQSESPSTWTVTTRILLVSEPEQQNDPE